MGYVYVNISKYCCDMYRYRESDLWPFQFMACARLSIRYHLQYLPSRHIRLAIYFFYILGASLSRVYFHEFTSAPLKISQSRANAHRMPYTTDRINIPNYTAALLWRPTLLKTPDYTSTLDIIKTHPLPITTMVLP